MYELKQIENPEKHAILLLLLLLSQRLDSARLGSQLVFLNGLHFHHSIYIL